MYCRDYCDGTENGRLAVVRSHYDQAMVKTLTNQHFNDWWIGLSVQKVSSVCQSVGSFSITSAILSITTGYTELSLYMLQTDSERLHGVWVDHSVLGHPTYWANGQPNMKPVTG